GAGQCRLGMLEALLLEPAKDRLRRREGQRKPQAAASHRREEALGLRRDEKKNRGGRRFLEVFQQRVLRVRVHRFRGIDQDDAQTRPMCSDCEEVGELAHLLDADLLALLLRGLRALLAGFGRHALGHDQAEVGMIAERKPVASAAGAAGPLARPGSFAQQRLRARSGEFELAQALPALYQDRVGQAFPQSGPILPGLFLPPTYHFPTSGPNYILDILPALGQGP